MCRLAVIPSCLRKKESTIKLLNHLEEAMGGDGNGFAYFNGSDSIKVKKATDLKNEIVKELDMTSDMFLYHSRKTSAGSDTNLNVQPFSILDDTAALCHNGTWSKYTDFKAALFCQGVMTADEYKDLSDTHTLAKMYSLPNVGPKALTLPESGVFLVYNKEFTDAYVKSGDLCAAKVDGMFIYASEFPSDMFPYIYTFKSGTVVRMYKNKFKILKGGVSYEKNLRSAYTFYNSHWKTGRK